MLVEVVAVNGPGEGVLEGPPVEQPHTLLLRRPPRQVARRRPRRAHLSPRLLTSDLLLLCDGTLKYYRVGNGVTSSTARPTWASQTKSGPT